MNGYRIAGRPLAVILMILWGCAVPVVPSAAGQDSSSVAGMYAGIVFTVNAYPPQGFDSSGARTDGKVRRSRNVGAAFPVEGDSFVITLGSVVRNAEKIEVFGGGIRYGATVAGTDSGVRIVVLKLDRQLKTTLPPVGRLQSVTPGGRVTFLGISKGGKVFEAKGTVKSVRAHDGMMVVSAEGNPGICGTPVFDSSGRVIGLLAYRLNSAAVEKDPNPANNSFLVFSMEYAALQARSIINRFQANSGWLGLSTALDTLVVQRVAPGGPAEKSGIQRDDRIVEFNGKPVATPEELVRGVGATHPGDKVKIKVIRNGGTLAFDILLAGHPDTGGK